MGSTSPWLTPNTSPNSSEYASCAYSVLQLTNSAPIPEHQHERQRGGHVRPGAAAQPGDAERARHREDRQADERR